MMGRKSFERQTIRGLTILAAAVLLVQLAAACGSDSGAQEAESSPQAKAAIARYRSFLEESSAALVTDTKRLLEEIEAGDLTAAQSRYATARVPYGHIELVSESFGDLDSRINAPAGEVPAAELGGFHRIEKALNAERTTEGTTPAARQLLADVEELRRRLSTVDLQAALIAASASRQLAEISASKLAGEEERYSDNDLSGVAANVEGVEAAFEALKPLLAEPAELERRFEQLYATLGGFGTLARESDQPRELAPGTSFLAYSEVAPAEIRKLAQQVDELARLFSGAQAEIAET